MHKLFSLKPHGSASSLLSLGILTATAFILLWSGLSVRSLWGPEGRWGVIVKEMLQSGNYFVPTINGVTYFDKPLFSYWAMLPFVWVGGLNEAMLRVPGTLAGAGTIIVVFLIGRRLFNVTAAFLAAAFLLTSPMFLFWARTASAEMMNTFAVVVMFWIFLVSRSENRSRYLLLFYTVGAVACFVKGLVAPAVCFFAIFLWSLGETLVRLRKLRFKTNSLTGIMRDEFFWLISSSGLLGLLSGLVVFAMLLLLPVLFNGSWVSVSLMWKENVVRFLSPFDHRDPPQAYLVSILQFCAPWTFLMISSLWHMRCWKPGMARRWTLVSALGVLLFFLLSGSRRSYYILPLIPFLALITGKSAAEWIGEVKASARVMNIGVVATLITLITLPAALLYVYLSMHAYRHESELLIGALVLIGAIAALVLLWQKERLKSLSVLLVVVFVIDLWGFTLGMKLAEKERTLKDFGGQVAEVIDKVGEDNIALCQVTAELIFYLNRKSVLTEVNNIEEIEEFARKRSAPFVLINLAEAPSIINGRIDKIVPVVVQRAKPDGREERFALMSFQNTQ